ncbi:hypothetical protein NFD60_08020 [Staphylococcus epidermidis]|nr:hypothetical protein NFD60_08020 [Staphylococcus epidermidis]
MEWSFYRNRAGEKETVELMQMLLKDKVDSEGKSIIYEGQRGSGEEN